MSASGTGPNKWFCPRDGDLPPAIDVGMKVLVVYQLTLNSFVYSQAGRLPYLPFLPWLDQIPSWCFAACFLPVLYLAPVAIFLNFHRQRAAFLLGLVVVLVIISSKPLYSTSQLFSGLLLILIGLYRSSDRFFRWQFALVYGGAALNKLLLADWWNGQYMRGFSQLYAGPWWPWVAETEWAARGLGLATIGVEFSLAILLLFPRFTRWAILLGLLFHGSMLCATVGRLSWFYLYVCAAGYVLLLDWPGKRLRWCYLFFGGLLLLYYGRRFL